MSNPPAQDLAEESSGPLRPVLQRYPDARRAPIRLFSAVTLVYTSFILGPGIGAVVALYNAVCLRRFSNAVSSVLLGLAGWATFVFVAVVAQRIELNSAPAIFLTSRALHFGVGGLLALSQANYLRGHSHLGGDEVPLLPTCLVAFAITLIAPWRLMLILWGVPGGR